jgi:hypothetical protein
LLITLDPQIFICGFFVLFLTINLKLLLMEGIKFLGKFLLANLFLYGIGTFIAFDPNPLNWWLFSAWGGRVLFLFIELYVLATVAKD